MILFYELSENSVDAALEKLPLPKSEALEIIESYMEGGSDAAVTGAFGCLVVRIYDGGEYLFSYPYPLTESADEAGFLSAAAFAGRDDMEVSVSGNEERILLTARFDNLGKGASGAAIQNMNILLGVDETTGLVTEG